jgi:prevent-host-death family protein
VTRISASKFKEQCLAILDRVDGEGIVITKHGKPVARLIPIRADSRELLGCLKNRIKIHGDIIGTGVTWDAES